MNLRRLAHRCTVACGLMLTAAVDLWSILILVVDDGRVPVPVALAHPALAAAAAALGPFAWLLLHCAASASIAVIAWSASPRELRSPAPSMLAWLAVYNLLVPTATIWWRVAVWVGYRWRIVRRDEPVATVAEPQYTVHLRARQPTVARARLRTNLTNPDVPEAQRVASLLAIQDVPASITSGLLRQLLADPQDDMRLLAYGMLDGKEKAISNRLLAEEAALKTNGAPDAQFGSHKRLAELHWELVVQRLVQGDVRLHACRQSRSHARSALGLDATDGGLWLLLARIELVLGDLDAGQKALFNAETNGLPRNLLLPLIAEYAYRRRHFTAVRRAFEELGTAPGTLQAAAAWRYWTAGPLVPHR